MLAARDAARQTADEEAVPLAKALAVEKTRREQLEKALALVQEELKACEEKLSAKEEELATEKAKSQRLMELNSQMRSISNEMEEIQTGRLAVDWKDRLREYLALHRKQKDAQKTVKNVESALRPWVLWLVENGNRPTNQRILAYLTSQVDLSRLSY